MTDALKKQVVGKYKEASSFAVSLKEDAKIMKDL